MYWKPAPDHSIAELVHCVVGIWDVTRAKPRAFRHLHKWMGFCLKWASHWDWSVYRSFLFWWSVATYHGTESLSGLDIFFLKNSGNEPFVSFDSLRQFYFSMMSARDEKAKPHIRPSWCLKKGDPSGKEKEWQWSRGLCPGTRQTDISKAKCYKE